MSKTTTKTIDEVRAEFHSTGISISKWAERNNLPVGAVYRALRKETRGLRGDAHKAAVALGLKNGTLLNDAGDLKL